MSPKVFAKGEFLFYFHSYDTQHEERASVHVGKGSQSDAGDAKIWLEPRIEVARVGRTLKFHQIKSGSENHTAKPGTISGDLEWTQK